MIKSITALSLAFTATVAVASPTYTVTTTDITPKSMKMLDTTTAMESGKFGDVIAMGKDVVALGQSTYDLVIKGKPANTTEYAPISVIPKDPATKEPVDIFDLENSSRPMDRLYKTEIKNFAGRKVVTFTYRVIYTYGASYNGAGKYLTNVQIVPASVSTKFGWDFSASMKVTGVLNHGTKDSPVAGVLINIKYTMNSWNRAEERNDTLHIAGNGGIKFYGVR